LAVIYPVPRVDRHEPAITLAVVIFVAAVATVFAFVRWW
jgi:hypothetical protein